MSVISDGEQVRDHGPGLTHHRLAGENELPQPSTLPLHGIRVLEMGNYIAAPMAGRLLADFGAEVIKIERPGTGDELRRWRLNGGDTSMLFRTVNRNKKSVVADLATPDGGAVVLELLNTCDALIENFRPGTLDRWGLGTDVLAVRRPKLVVARVSAFGQTGPMAERPGFAAVAEAYGGLRELVGEADRPPSRVGVSIGDSIAGLYAAFGVVMSLLQQLRQESAQLPISGPLDQQVDVALYEAVFSMMESLVPDHSAHGVERRRTGGRVEGIAPSNAYACSDDSQVVLAANSDSIFHRCMIAIGRPDLAEDDDLATNPRRWARRDELDRAIEGWTASRPREVVLRVMDEAGVPAGPILTARDIVADEQYAARGMVQRLQVETGRGVAPVVFPGIVPLLGARSIPVRAVGPDLGQHTREVLSDLLGWDGRRVDAYSSEVGLP